MKITVDRSDILEPLNHACRIIERRNAVSISYHILLQADDETLKIKASGPEIEIIAKVSASIHVAGSFTLPAQLLYDIIRKLPDGSEISLSNDDSEEKGVIVCSGNSKFVLQSFPESEFSISKEEDCFYSFEIGSLVLKSLIERTHFAMGTEDVRYYLNGTFFHVMKDDLKLRAVATDGHRLAVAEADISDHIKEMPSIIVPRKAVGEIQKIVSSKDFLVKIGISGSRIYLNFGSISISSRLIDGEFPNYQGVVPDKNDKKMQVKCNSLKQSVDRVSTISSIRSQAVKFSLSSGKLHMTVDNPDIGNAIEDVDVSYTDCDMDIGFNYKYLLEIIDNITDDEMVFLLDDSNSSALVKGIGDDDAFYVLMPMRI